MINLLCALCRQKQQLRLLYKPTFKNENIETEKFSARRLPDKIHYRIVKCGRCGLVFSSPIFSPVKIAKFYKKSLCNYDEQISYLVTTYMDLFDRFRKILPKNPRVLEIGCGNGFFLNALMKRGIKDIYGIEPSSRMVALSGNRLRKRIKVDVFRRNQFPANSFDIILCFHTLDHLVRPNEFIKESLTLLKKGGLVLVVVHDIDGLSVKIFGENSPIFDIEHIFLFGKKTLREIFVRNKFEVLKVFDVKNTYPLSYWLRMTGFPLYLKNVGQKILKMLMLSKVPLSLASGNIGIVAKKT